MCLIILFFGTDGYFLSLTLASSLIKYELPTWVVQKNSFIGRTLWKDQMCGFDHEDTTGQEKLLM